MKEQAGRDLIQHCIDKYGSAIGAWHRGLDPNHDFDVSKLEMFSFCARTDFKGDVRNAWDIFDKDDSGDIAIEEFDVHNAAILAEFQAFIIDKGKCKEGVEGLLFHVDNRKRLYFEDFEKKLSELGFEPKPFVKDGEELQYMTKLRPIYYEVHLKKLWHCVNVSGCGHLLPEDLSWFLLDGRIHIGLICVCTRSLCPKQFKKKPDFLTK